MKALTHPILAAAMFFCAATGEGLAGEKEAQALLDAIADMSGAPGLSAAVSQNGIMIWAGQSGFADLERKKPVTQTTRFRIASVSKLLTAALALKLSADGLLNLDEDVRTYVPDWPDHDGAIITLRQLAAHTSGIAHYGAGDRRTPFNEDDRLNDSLAIYAHKLLLSAPGEAYNYSSYGYALMGAAIENAAGSSFEEALSAHLIEPLSLRRTSVEDIRNLPAEASRLYGQGGATLTPNNQRAVLGATGILSTPGDLVHFADAYMRGDIVGSQLVEQSLTPATLNNGDPVDAGRFAVGFGWRIGENWEGETVFHHAGLTPGARSILTVNAGRKLSAALLSNASWTSRIETTGEMIAAAAAEHPDPKTCPTGEWLYEGIFASDPGAYPEPDNARGSVSLFVDDGICRMNLAPRGELAAWLARLPGDAKEMTAIMVAERPSGLVFAVATPWGAFPLYVSGTASLELKGEFAGRTVDLSLRQ
ncbi:serine hydrolase domain-containing protein [Hyphococcus sp.]|uniref:serine hydrolase domain-containing protein n=1 Tax=Hyphococcus sp. TaxID=2038636 RepID=UPI0035C6CE5A